MYQTRAAELAARIAATRENAVAMVNEPRHGASLNGEELRPLQPAHCAIEDRQNEPGGS
jgi:hypothetical protein